MTLLTLRTSSICFLLTTSMAVYAQAKDVDNQLFQPEDVHRIKKVGDIAISPDGEWIAYGVGTTSVDKDENSSDLYMVSWDGSARIQLTHTEDSGESNPRFSPDGKYLAFIAARTDGKSEESDDPKAKSQIWLLNRAGGEAQRLTEIPGGVSGFEWSPDSSRLVIVSYDPEEKPEKDADEDGPSHDTPKPIVIDRYHFKQDRIGYLGNRYQRLYLFDLAKKEVALLTPGAFDSTQPTWGPDSDIIAFTSRRQGDPDRHDNDDIYVIAATAGAEARQVTTWEGPDGSPVFSPDGRWIAYLQGGPPKFSGYDPSQIAVISVDVGEALLPTSSLDRTLSSPHWSPDGKTLHFLLADDRIQSVASVPFRGGDVEVLYPDRAQPRVTQSFAIGKNGVATVSTFGQRPAEIYRADDGVALSDHNRELH